MIINFTILYADIELRIFIYRRKIIFLNYPIQFSHIKNVCVCVCVKS